MLSEMARVLVIDDEDIIGTILSIALPHHAVVSAHDGREGLTLVEAADPDVIVLADLTRGGDGDSAQSKIDFLRSHPVTAKLDAVRAGRFITVPGSSLDPGVRSVSAVEQISAGLAGLGR